MTNCLASDLVDANYIRKRKTMFEHICKFASVERINALLSKKGTFRKYKEMTRGMIKTPACLSRITVERKVH